MPSICWGEGMKNENMSHSDAGIPVLFLFVEVLRTGKWRNMRRSQIECLIARRDAEWEFVFNAKSVIESGKGWKIVSFYSCGTCFQGYSPVTLVLMR